MTQRVDAAVQVEIEIPLTIDVPEPVALAQAHDQIDAELTEHRHAPGNHVPVRTAQNASLFGGAVARWLVAHERISCGCSMLRRRNSTN